METGIFNSHQKLTTDYDKDIWEANVELSAAAVPVDVVSYQSTWRVQPNYIQWNLPVQPPPPPITTIVEYTTTLSAWEQQILEGIHLRVPQDEFVDALERQSVTACSDGSHAGPKASFGWVFSTADGHRLAECSGPCFGKTLSSYGAEGCGLLSMCRLLLHLKLKFQVRLQPCHLYCDNKSMLDRIGKPPADLSRVPPNSTLESDWDVLTQIWTTLQEFEDSEAPTFTHVKGHQDKKKRYSNLSLPAQLNVDADRLANRYLQDHPDKNYSRVTMMPVTRVQLHLPDGTITRKVKTVLRVARHGPPLEKKLMKDKGWTQETLDDVNWDASRIAMNRLRKHRTTLIKYVNGILPVGSMVTRYDIKYSPACPSCPEQLETTQHMIRCPGPTRQQWRQQFIHKLRMKLEKLGTALDLQELLLEGVKASIEGRAADTIHVPESAQDVATRQAAIGWEEALRGRLSQAWSVAQQRHMGAFLPKKNGQTWAASVAQCILSSFIDLWELRNRERHGSDFQTKAQAIRAQTTRELEHLYSWKGQVMPRHNWILATPLDQRKNLRTYAMRAFISNYKPILEESYKERLATG